MTDLLHTVLYDFHVNQGGKIVPFAGYAMPVQYKSGALNEHRQTRTSVGVFDVSHMGQITVSAASGKISDAAVYLESILPVELVNMHDGRQKYALLTADNGGIRDDLMIARKYDHFLLVVNAAAKIADLEYISDNIGKSCHIELIDTRGLLAVQGPLSEKVLRKIVPNIPQMKFMDCCTVQSKYGELWISRSGYTGEDGFEISIPEETIEDFTKDIAAQPEVEMIGLAARDTLRLEAGFCLYGNDIDISTTIVEAGLTWSINASRKPNGKKAGEYPGSDIIACEILRGPKRRRTGLYPHGRTIIRHKAELFADIAGNKKVGYVTSGGFGPTLNHPIAMGYIDSGESCLPTQVYCKVRGKMHPVTVTDEKYINLQVVR